MPVYLKAEMQKGYVSFSYKLEGENWNQIAANIDGSFMSDEACIEGWFTGAMAGICCQDLTDKGNKFLKRYCVEWKKRISRESV